MNGPLWMLALKINYISHFWKPNMPHGFGLRLPNLLLEATLMSSWHGASCPCLASTPYLNSKVSERRMTSDAQILGCWSKRITENPIFPIWGRISFYSTGAESCSVLIRAALALSRLEKVCHKGFCHLPTYFTLLKRLLGLHNAALLGACLKFCCWIRQWLTLLSAQL